MSPEKSLTPQIRFKGFTEAWEQRKLGELYTPASEKNDGSIGRDRIISVANMYFNSVVYVTDDDYLKTYNVMRLGDIAFEGNRSKMYAHGRFVENFIGDGIISHVFKVFRPRLPFDLLYWKYAINNELVMRDVLTKSTKASTMMHELVSQDFLREDIAVPSCLDEERQIGALFSKLDNLITLHQRKLDALKKIKSALLEKMFPKDGSNIPEIRFTGFTEAWEQRKVADIASSTRGGGTPSTSNKAYWNGEIPWIQSSDLSDGKLFGVMPRKYISTAGLNSSATQLVPKNSIAVVTRVGVGKLAFMPYSYTTSQDFLSLCRIRTEAYFTAYSLYQMLQSDLQTVQGTSIKGMTKENLLSKSIFVPRNIDEQHQLGLFFSSLDNLITLHQRKLDALKKIKSALLEKIFV